MFHSSMIPRIRQKLPILTAHQEFVAAPALAPPTAQVDETLLAQYRKEMDDASALPLPNDDDDDDF